MKKLFYYSVLLLIVLLISSCGKANSNSPSVSPSNSSSNSSSYLGDWTVRSLVGSTPISATVDESFIGMKATYTNKKASFGKDEAVEHAAPPIPAPSR
jgi:hypothetical protein